MSQSQPPGYQGSQRLSDQAGGFNALAFLVRTMLGDVATATLVRVEAVTNDGGVSPVGAVDVTPLVAQVDGFGVAQEHGTIYGCPYMRLQGGPNAVILDPKVGDIGIAVFASRDISSVIANKGPANPGSRRTHSMADGLYIGGALNGTPEQYVQFSDAGITLSSPSAITLQAPAVTIDASAVVIATDTLVVNATESVSVSAPTVAVNGNLNVSGTLTAGDIKQGGKSIGAPHTHNLTGGGHTLGVT
jgi:hypothetical protein